MNKRIKQFITISSILAIIVGLGFMGLTYAKKSNIFGAFPSWYFDGSQLQPTIPTAGIRVPALSNCDTIDTDANGVFSCGTDAAGSGGALGWAWIPEKYLLRESTTTVPVLIGGTATSSVVQFEVQGASLFDNVTTTNFAVTGLTNCDSIDTTANGDLVCGTDKDTTYSAGGTLLNLTGTTFSVNEGTLTDGKGCKYVSGTGLVCDQNYLTSESDPNFAAMDTEAELESHLTDVTNVYTNNDGNLTDDDLSDNTTDDLSEGTSNLYFTNERTDDRVANLIQNGTGLTWTYDDASNTLTGNVSLSPFDTGDLAEGTNLYYTDARVASYINGSTTMVTLDDIDTESDLESVLSDVTDVFTNNDGSLSDDDLSNNSINDLSDVNTTGWAQNKVLKFDSSGNLIVADDNDTTYSAGGTLLQLSGTQFSLKEGTLTSGKICKYDSTNGLVCDYDDSDTTYSAGTGLDLTGTTFSLSHLGLESLTDPNANRLYYWNDTNNTTEWLDYSNWDTDKTDDLTTGTTFSGDVSGAYNNLAIGDDKVTEADLKVVNSPTDEYCLTYEATDGDFEWQSCGTGGSSEWTDSGTFLYPTETSDDIVIGSNSTSTATFWFDVSAATSYLGTIGSGTTWNGNAIDISDYTNLTAGNHLTLSGDTLDVDDDFLLNTGDTATGDYTFDGGTLFIDSTNNRVGIGTTGPTKTLEVNGEIYAKGDINASTNGADETTPRVFGFKDLSSGEACRFQFGDKHNAFQNKYGGDVTIYSYWGLNLVGGMQNYNSGFSPPSFTFTKDTGVSIINSNWYGDDPGDEGPIVTLGIIADDGQKSNQTEWRDYNGNVLSLVDAQGHFNIGGSATTTYTLNVSGTLNVTATSTLHSLSLTNPLDISDYTNLAVSGTLLDLTGDTLSVNEGTLTDGKLCKYVAGTGLDCNYDDSDTTYTAGGTLLQLSGTQFSVKEGTLTSGKICKYDSTNGLVCDYDDQDTTYSAGTGLDLTGTTFSLSHLGLESLSDPNANRLYYWNDANNTTEWLSYSDPLNITSGSLGLKYTAPLSLDGSGNLYIGSDAIKDTHIDWGTGANQVSTDDVPEGSNNLYWTQSRFDSALIATSTWQGDIKIDGYATSTRLDVGNGTHGVRVIPGATTTLEFY